MMQPMPAVPKKKLTKKMVDDWLLAHLAPPEERALEAVLQATKRVKPPMTGAA